MDSAPFVRRELSANRKLFYGTLCSCQKQCKQKLTAGYTRECFDCIKKGRPQPNYVRHGCYNQRCRVCHEEFLLQLAETALAIESVTKSTPSQSSVTKSTPGSDLPETESTAVTVPEEEAVVPSASNVPSSTSVDDEDEEIDSMCSNGSEFADDSFVGACILCFTPPMGMTTEDLNVYIEDEKTREEMISANQVENRKTMKAKGAYSFTICECGSSNCCLLFPDKFKIDLDTYVPEAFCKVCGDNQVFELCRLRMCIACKLRACWTNKSNPPLMVKPAPVVDEDGDEDEDEDDAPLIPDHSKYLVCNSSPTAGQRIIAYSARSPLRQIDVPSPIPFANRLTSPPKSTESPMPALLGSPNTKKRAREPMLSPHKLDDFDTMTPAQRHQAIIDSLKCSLDGCDNDFVDCCATCSKDYCAAHLPHSRHFSESSSSSSSSSSNQIKPTVDMTPVAIIDEEGKVAKTIPRAEFPAILDTLIQSFTVNGTLRHYLPFMFDRSRIVSKPPNFYWQELYSDYYFKLYNYNVYGACLKGKNIYFSRCGLVDIDDPDKTSKYILMRIMSTTCDKPIRTYYVYSIVAKTFMKVSDTFLHDHMISDPTFIYDDKMLETMFRDFCDNLREIYSRDRAMRRECKDHYTRSNKEAPDALILKDGQPDETDDRWNNVNGIVPPRSKRMKKDDKKSVTVPVSNGSKVSYKPVVHEPKTPRKVKESPKEPEIVSTPAKRKCANVASERAKKQKVEKDDNFVAATVNHDEFPLIVPVSVPTPRQSVEPAAVPTNEIRELREEINRLRSIVQQQSTDGMSSAVTMPPAVSTVPMDPPSNVGPLLPLPPTTAQVYNLDDRMSVNTFASNQFVNSSVAGMHGNGEPASLPQFQPISGVGFGGLQSSTVPQTVNNIAQVPSSTVSSPDMYVSYSRLQMLYAEMRQTQLNWRNQELSEQLFLAKLLERR